MSLALYTAVVQTVMAAGLGVRIWFLVVKGR